MFYTYVHLEGKEVVYVGFGQKNRQFAKTFRRSDEHAEWISLMLEKVGKSYSKIIKYFKEKSDALYFERLMIKKYQPRFNKVHTKDFRRPDLYEYNKTSRHTSGSKNFWFGKINPHFIKWNKSKKRIESIQGQDNPNSMTNRIKRQKALEKVTGVKWYFKIMNPTKCWKGGKK